MSEHRVRINPRHKEIDFERLAEAILDLATTINDDAIERLGKQIRTRLEQNKKGAA